MDLDLNSPDHSTLSRRAKELDVELRTFGEKTEIHMVVDSTGLQIRGQGPWANAKHGKKGTREWRKLHVGVDENGMIVAEKLTDSNVDDASVVPDLVGQAPDDKNITRFTADGAFDQNSIYEMFAELGSRVVVPRIKTATPSKARTPGAKARNRTINRVQKVGRRRWRKETGYHKQGRAENTFYRYKQIIGGRLHARESRNQKTEARLACNILNRMLELGAPRSEAIRT